MLQASDLVSLQSFDAGHDVLTWDASAISSVTAKELNQLQKAVASLMDWNFSIPVFSAQCT